MNHYTLSGSEAFDSLNVGDVIRVPQYENALRVSFDGRDAGLLGVEFSGNPNGTQKTLIQNENSGEVYLVAGSTDKGHVSEVEVVAEVEA